MADIETRFTARGRWRERLPTILEPLEALGRTRRPQAGAAIGKDRDLSVHSRDEHLQTQSIDCSVPTLYVVSQVGKVIVSANEIEHLAVSFENAQ